MPIQVVDTNDISWNPSRKNFHGYSEIFGGGFPREFHLKSTRTGVIATFKPVGVDHPLWDEDGWDGEQQIYYCSNGPESLTDIVVVLTHAY